MECKLQKPMGEDEKLKIKEILSGAKTIAIVGLSPDEERDSNKVGKYLIGQGYNVIPVYPKEESILGQKVYRSLKEIEAKVDIVNVFRKSDALAAIIDEALEISPTLIWAQIGCYDEAAEEKAKSNGVAVVSNRCIMVEHRKLFG